MKQRQGEQVRVTFSFWLLEYLTSAASLTVVTYCTFVPRTLQMKTRCWTGFDTCIGCTSHSCLLLSGLDFYQRPLDP